VAMVPPGTANMSFSENEPRQQSFTKSGPVHVQDKKKKRSRKSKSLAMQVASWKKNIHIV